MSNIYIPILKAKSNEFKAVKNTREDIHNRMIPLFQIADPKVNGATYQKADMPKCEYIENIVAKIAEHRQNKYVFFDGFQWFDSTYTETNEHVYSYTFNKLKAAGALPIPVVGYDRWEIADYRQAINGLGYQDSYLIRLEKDAFEDSYDEDYFLERLDGILDGLNLVPSNCGILLDFGDVSNISIDDMTDVSSHLLNVLNRYNFKYIVIAGCSVPSDISQAVKNKDSVGTVVRKEMIAWKALRANNPELNLIFGDYGVRGPNSATEGTIAPHINGKVRYTINDAFFISRGHAQTQNGGWSQMKTVCEKVINSGHYLFESFSWGDEYMLKCSKGLEKTGGVNLWIAVDTNHHMAYVIHEVAEELSTTVSTLVSV